MKKLFGIGCALGVSCCSFVLEGSENLLKPEVLTRFLVAEFSPEMVFSCMPFTFLN